MYERPGLAGDGHRSGVRPTISYCRQERLRPFGHGLLQFVAVREYAGVVEVLDICGQDAWHSPRQLLLLAEVPRQQLATGTLLCDIAIIYSW